MTLNATGASLSAEIIDITTSEILPASYMKTLKIGYVTGNEEDLSYIMNKFPLLKKLTVGRFDCKKMAIANGHDFSVEKFNITCETVTRLMKYREGLKACCTTFYVNLPVLHEAFECSFKDSSRKISLSVQFAVPDLTTLGALSRINTRV